MHSKLHRAAFVLLIVGSALTTLTPTKQASAATVTYGKLLESWYEGWDRLYVEMKYNNITYMPEDEGKVIKLTNKNTGNVLTITSSYEGGRGYTPADYWSEAAPCPNCVLTTKDAVKGVTNLVSYLDPDTGMKYTLFNKNPYLFVTERPSSDKALAAVVNSLAFTNPAKSTRFSKVKVALYTDADLTDDSSCTNRGTLVPKVILKTPQVLGAALTNLFNSGASYFDGAEQYSNFIANSSLAFQKVTIVNKVARIYLTGEMGDLTGECSPKYIISQLEETALQFPTVKRVEVLVNGEKINESY